MPALDDQQANEAPRLDELTQYTAASLEHSVSVWQLRRAVQQGRIRSYKLPGGQVVLHRDDVAAWAETRAEGDA